MEGNAPRRQPSNVGAASTRGRIALIDETGMPLPASLGGPLTPQQFVEFVVSPLVLHAAFMHDAVDQTHGHLPVTNAGTTYTSIVPFMTPLLPPIDAGVARVNEAPAAVNLLDRNGETSAGAHDRGTMAGPPNGPVLPVDLTSCRYLTSPNRPKAGDASRIVRRA